MASILITGANRGIGLALTRQYAQSGWRVYACCRSPENAHELNKIVSEANGQVSIHVLDICNDLQRDSLAAQLRDTPIDILFNNAGIYGDWDYQGFGRTDTAEWQQVFLTNVIAPMKMMEAFAGSVAASEHKVIANMTSKMGSMTDNGSGGSYLYRSGKAALNAVSVSAARDLKQQGITVVVLHPGWVRTEMGGPHGELSTEACAMALQRNLSTLTPEDSGRFIDIDGSTIPW